MPRHHPLTSAPATRRRGTRTVKPIARPALSITRLRPAFEGENRRGAERQGGGRGPGKGRDGRYTPPTDRRMPDPLDWYTVHRRVPPRLVRVWLAHASHRGRQPISWRGTASRAHTVVDGRVGAQDTRVRAAGDRDAERKHGCAFRVALHAVRTPRGDVNAGLGTPVITKRNAAARAWSTAAALLRRNCWRVRTRRTWQTVTRRVAPRIR